MSWMEKASQRPIRRSGTGEHAFSFYLCQVQYSVVAIKADETRTRDASRDMIS